jgi:LacI family transcriptional regulator, galactose operon repressor
MSRLLALKTLPDGVFRFNDRLAMGAMNLIWDRGLRIPDDIAMIGCGNLHYSDLLRVPLSSMDQHSRQIGQEASRLTLGILSSKVRPTTESIVLQTELVMRRSTERNPEKSVGSKSRVPFRALRRN